MNNYKVNVCVKTIQWTYIEWPCRSQSRALPAFQNLIPRCPSLVNSCPSPLERTILLTVKIITLLLFFIVLPPIYMFLNVVSMWLFLNLMWLESYCVFSCVYVLFLLLNNYFYGNHLCLCVKLFIRFYSCVMFHSMNIPQFISSFFTWDV